MSAAAIEVTPVEDLEGMLCEPPPCEARRGWAVCGCPSAVRIRLASCPCGAPPWTGFLCKTCWGLLRGGWAVCGPAGCGRTHTSWQLL